MLSGYILSCQGQTSVSCQGQFSKSMKTIMARLYQNKIMLRQI